MSVRGLTLATLPFSRVPGFAIVLVVLCAVFAVTSMSVTRCAFRRLS